MKTFSPETREAMFLAGNGYCQCSKECVKPAHDCDHIIPNTKPNNKLFPLFLHSPFNCMIRNRGCHEQKGMKPITLSQARVYEEYLERITGKDQT